jgi:methylated-DNA-[protein]-cysteine S-methyltransferase
MPGKSLKKPITSFREKVCKIVKKIPKGKVLSYTEVARRAGCSSACRAVGIILNKNTDAGIPCHRVVKLDGRVGGYNKGTENKTKLLKKEGVKIENGQIRQKFD